MDDASNPPVLPGRPEPNYRRTTIIFSEADSEALEDLVKGADQRNWVKPSRSSMVRALVRMARDGMNKKGELSPYIGPILEAHLTVHLSNIAAEAPKARPPQGGQSSKAASLIN